METILIKGAPAPIPDAVIAEGRQAVAEWVAAQETPASHPTPKPARGRTEEE